MDIDEEFIDFNIPEDSSVVSLSDGIDTSGIQHDLKTIPEIRSSHSVRNIMEIVSKLSFFEKLRSKESIQRFVSKGVYLRLPEDSIVYSKGDKEDGVYIILSGCVKVLEKEPESDTSEDDNYSGLRNGGKIDKISPPNKRFRIKNIDVKRNIHNNNRPHTTKASDRGKMTHIFDETIPLSPNKKKKKKQGSPKGNNRVKRRQSMSPALPFKQGLPTGKIGSSGTKLLGRRRSIHHMIGTGGFGRASRNSSPTNYYHETLNLSRKLEHGDDGYKYIKQFGPGAVFGLKEKMNIRINNLRKFSTKVSVDGTELLYLDHQTYEDIMNGKDKHFVYNVKLQANKIIKDEGNINKSVLMVLDSMFEDNDFFKSMKNGTVDLRHNCIEKLNIVFVEKGRTIVQSHQKCMFAYICLSGIAKSVGIDTMETNLDKTWIYPGNVLGLQELLNEETIKQKFIAHKDTLFGVLSRDDYYRLFENPQSRKQKESRDWLRQIMPGLENFKTSQLNALLVLFKKCQARKGEIIVSEDDQSKFIYFVKQGCVTVRKELIGDTLPKRQVKISSLITGSFFGVVAYVTNTLHRATYVSESSMTVLMKISISDFNKKFLRADIRYLQGLEAKRLKDQEQRYKKFQNIKSYECDRDFSMKERYSLGDYRDITSNPSHVHEPYEPIEKKKKIASDIQKRLYTHGPSFYSPLKVKTPSRTPTFSSTSQFETYNPFFRPNGNKRANEGELKNNRLQERLKEINKTSGLKPIDLRNEKSILTVDYLRQIIDISKVVPPNWLNKHSGTMWRESSLGKPKKLPRVIWNDDDKVRLYYADTKTYKMEAKKKKDHMRAFGAINPDVTHRIRQRIEDSIRPGYLKWIDP
jgi:CRP-like cAMP-binding protein